MVVLALVGLEDLVELAEVLRWMGRTDTAWVLGRRGFEDVALPAEGLDELCELGDFWSCRPWLRAVR